MTFNELNEMTVLQLRRLAREKGVVLGAGIDKAGIIEKLLPAISDNSENSPDDADRLAEPKFQAAWHNSDTPRYNARPAYQAPGAAPRPAWQNTTPSGQHLTHEQQHAQPLRPGGFAPRFGPAASVHPAAPAPAESGEPSPAAPPSSPLPEKRISHGAESGFGPRSFGPISTPQQRTPEPFSPIQSQDTGIQAPTLEELLSSGDYEEGGGILELHPDGYGFLRNANFQPSTKDIYVSMAQIRRFGLRTGDMIEGKIRPQREGDSSAVPSNRVRLRVSSSGRRTGSSSALKAHSRVSSPWVRVKASRASTPVR